MGSQVAAPAMDGIFRALALLNLLPERFCKQGSDARPPLLLVDGDVADAVGVVA